MLEFSAGLMNLIKIYHLCISDYNLSKLSQNFLVNSELQLVSFHIRLNYIYATVINVKFSLLTQEWGLLNPHSSLLFH